MASKSKKGGDWERTFCKQLSLWWSEGERDDIFWRTSQSGGRATQRRKQGRGTAGSYGDVGLLDLSGKPFLDLFCVELKRGYSKETDILNILDSNQKKPKIIEFWEQCKTDTLSANRKHPLVVFRRDYKKACVMISLASFQWIQKFAGQYKKDKLIIRWESIWLVVLRINDFFDWVDPAIFKNK